MAGRFTLRELLESKGISQSAFARDADLHFATVHRICNNDTAQVSLETLDKIMGALQRAGFRGLRLEDVVELDALRTPRR